MNEVLITVLERSRAVGFLGPGPVVDHVAHAAVFGRGLDQFLPEGPSGPVGSYADIGAGGGVPSLPLLLDRPGLEATLVDAAQKRCSFLSWAVTELGLADRVRVVCARVEELAHRPEARFAFDAVIARGFGPPASTVECGAGLLAQSGYLIISEPPERREWPVAGLAQVGLTRVDAPQGVVVFQREGSLGDQFPRRAKQQQSRPLFG